VGFPVEVLVPDAYGLSWKLGKVTQAVPAQQTFVVVLQDRLAPGGKRAGSSEVLAGSCAIGETLTDVRRSELRLACAHCERHQLMLAELPLFCDYCKRAMQRPTRKYFQESLEAARAAGSSGTLRLCNSCFGRLRQLSIQQLRVEVSSKLQRDGGALDWAEFHEQLVPVRDGEGPLLSGEEDTRWVQCEDCHLWYHFVCGLYDEQHGKGGSAAPFVCVACIQKEPARLGNYASWRRNPAEALPQTLLSRHIEKAVADDLREAGVTHEPVQIRLISSVFEQSHCPEEMVQRMFALGGPYPSEFPYRSKAIVAFQKVDGIDIAFFAMYVQEYGEDCPEPNKNRVYISYLDSVRYFESEPGGQRTLVYHSILVAYLQHVRMLGFRWVHIWVEPPKAGDEYIFFARPDQHKRPMKRDKLRSWYVAMLDKAKEKGIIHKFGEALRCARGGWGAPVRLVGGSGVEGLCACAPALCAALTSPAPPLPCPTLPPQGRWRTCTSRWRPSARSPCSTETSGPSPSPSSSPASNRSTVRARPGRAPIHLRARTLAPHHSHALLTRHLSLPATCAALCRVPAEESDSAKNGGVRLHKLHAQEVVQRAQQEIQARARSRSAHSPTCLPFAPALRPPTPRSLALAYRPFLATPTPLSTRSPPCPFRTAPFRPTPFRPPAFARAQHLKRHFLVAQMKDLERMPTTDLDPEVNNELANSREVLLGHCQASHWQFNSQRYAQYSTMMLLNNLNRKSCLCTPTCRRGRKQDSSTMVGCDVCDNWCGAATHACARRSLPLLCTQARSRCATCSHARKGGSSAYGRPPLCIWAPTPGQCAGAPSRAALSLLRPSFRDSVHRTRTRARAHLPRLLSPPLAALTTPHAPSPPSTRPLALARARAGSTRSAWASRPSRRTR
jgi:hypothetical protein